MNSFVSFLLVRLGSLRDEGPLVFYTQRICAPAGLIHVGAHLAEESIFYEGLGIKNLFWVEANPEIYNRLITIVGRENCASALVFREEGVIFPFKISNNSVSSSVYDFSRDNPWGEVEMVNEIKLVSTTLDALARISPRLDHASKYGVLVLDIQGAELPALEGACELLKNLNAVIVEISKKSTYVGGTEFKSLDRFLKSKGFKRVGEWIDFKNGHGDALYVAGQLSIPFQAKLLGKFTWLSNFLEFALRALIRRHWINPR